MNCPYGLPVIFLFVCLIAANAAASTDPRDSESPFGVLAFVSWDHQWNNHHFAGGRVEEAARLMKEAGIGFVRMDFIWDDIEPEMNRWDFAKYDRIVNIFTKHDIKILGILGYSASWTKRHWNAAPSHVFYVRYAREVARRYKDRVKYWEVWNEPDSPNYWLPQDGLKAYTKLLREVYPALKEEDATCQVVLGGLTRHIPISLKKIYKNGGGSFFDIVAIHPFVDPLLPNAEEILHGVYRSAYKVMEANGDGEKPVWFTELGCPGAPAGGPQPGWWLGKSADEKQQAVWLQKVYDKPLGWKNVKKIFWAFLRDTPDYFKNGVDYFGLVRQDFSRKPAFEAYRKVTRRK